MAQHTSLGIIDAGKPCKLKINASAPDGSQLFVRMKRSKDAGDLPQGLKISQDALCEALGVNDNRIVEIHLFKTLDRDNPRLDCTLTINNLLPAEAQQHSLSRYLLNRHIKS